MLLSLAMCPKNLNILMLGLGGGYIPNLFKRHLPGHRLTVVELDPMVAEVAKTYFGFEPSDNVQLIIGEGLRHLELSEDHSYDQIWLDAFNGQYIPTPMLSTSFLELVKSKLIEGGLAVQNLHQTVYNSYRRQLHETTRVFSREPVTFLGSRSGNTVAMSLNSSELELPSSLNLIRKAIKAFQRTIGPYNLLQEAEKLNLEPLP
jgi:spermidine synthase